MLLARDSATYEQARRKGRGKEEKLQGEDGNLKEMKLILGQREPAEPTGGKNESQSQRSLPG